MADEKNGSRPLGDRPEDHDPSLLAAQRASVASGTAGDARRSEWTASDGRGALHEAPATVEPEAVLQGSSTAATDTGYAPSSGNAAAQVEPRRSLWPVAAGVIVGAIIGAGSAAAVFYAMQQNGSGALEQKVASLGSKVDTLGQRPDPQQAIAGLRGSVAGLDGKVAEAQKSAATAEDTARKAAAAAAKPPPGFDPSSLQQKISALQSDVDGLRKQSGKEVEAKLGSMQAAIDALKKQDSDQGGKLGAVQSSVADLKKQDTDQGTKLGALASTVSELKKQDADEGAKVGGILSSISDLKKQDADQGGKIAAFASTATALQSLQGKVSTVEKQAGATQAGVTSLQGEQKTLEGKVREPALAVVTDSLVGQIARGEPYTLQVETLASLGAEPAKIAVLRENASKGVPSAQVLAAEFKPLADPMTAVQYKAPANASFMERLQSGMSSLVSVRSTDATSGNDLTSHVSLIQADLAHDDVNGAYATWNALPADAKAKSQAWGALAKTSSEAMTAARALRDQAIATLGGKKS